jgi:hypothetical protein
MNNMQTARVNVQRLTEKLPRNLRTLLALGMFMPRVSPGRLQSRTNIPSDQAFFGTPFLDSPSRNGAVADIRRHSNPPSGTGSVHVPRRTGSLGQNSFRSFISEHAAPAAGAPPTPDDVAEAVKLVEAHLQSDVEVMDAVDVLRDAVGTPVPGGAPVVRTSSSKKASSFFLSKGGKMYAQQAKDRAAQVKQDLQNNTD